MSRKKAVSAAASTKPKPKPKSVKGRTIRNIVTTPSRNAKCTCGSGRKFKKCCGKPKSATVVHNPYQQFNALYTDEQRIAVKAFIKRFGFQPNPAQLLTFMEGDEQECVDMIVKALRAMGERTHSSNARFIHAVRETGHLITPLNQGSVDAKLQKVWAACLHEYGERDAGAI